MDTIVIILALCGGALLSVQAAINGRLGSQVGVLRSAFLTFATGALVTGLLILFFAPATSVNLLQVPKWQLLGALRRALHRHYGAGGAADDRHRYGYRGGDLWPADDEPADRQLWLAGQPLMAFSPARLAAVICHSLALCLIYTSGKSATSHEAARAEQ